MWDKGENLIHLIDDERASAGNITECENNDENVRPPGRQRTGLNGCRDSLYSPLLFLQFQNKVIDFLPFPRKLLVPVLSNPRESNAALQGYPWEATTKYAIRFVRSRARISPFLTPLNLSVRYDAAIAES